jgi:Recombination directionality factor-like
MAIIGLQRRIREVGRIRIGVQADTRTGRKAPKKLDRFRFTSSDRSSLDAIAQVYGGTVEPWDNNGTAQWEVITPANELRIALPPDPADMAWSQWYETWAKGFCQRRCDGVRETTQDRACDCDPENRTCKPTSRLSVLLPDVAALGVWRLESHGYYAAVELAGAIELIAQMAGVHSVIPARLRLEHREVRRLIDGKPTVRKFAVPCIDLDVSILAVRTIALKAGDDDGPAELPAGWQPVPEVEPPEVLSVVEQVREAEKPRSPSTRSNAPAPLPATGVDRRTPKPPDGDVCVHCQKPYGAEPLVKNTTGQGGRFVHRACQDASTSETSPVGDGPPTASGDGGGGGAASGMPDTAEPTPAAARARDRMTHGQHRKVMAMVAALFPCDGLSSTEADEYRRAVTLGICEALGSPGLVSRSDIDGDLAQVLIDALEAIEAGQVQWDHDSGQLVDLTTGELIGFRRGEQ